MPTAAPRRSSWRNGVAAKPRPSTRGNCGIEAPHEAGEAVVTEAAGHCQVAGV